MPFIRIIKLPVPLILQSIFAIGLGLYLAFFRKPPIIFNGDGLLIPFNTSPMTADICSLLGLLIASFNLYWILASGFRRTNLKAPISDAERDKLTTSSSTTATTQ